MRTIKRLPANGEVRCPYPKCGGQVVEVDVAIRWNRLEVVDAAVCASTHSDYQFERADGELGPGFICDNCLRGVQFDPTPNITYD